MLHRTRRPCSVTALSAAGLAALLLTAGASADAHASDRYGGVWHEGVATGAFVPLEAGMTFAALQQYRTYWDDLRITDFEIQEQGCPAEEIDLTASQWEEGTFYDELLVYESLEAFESGLAVKCDEGMVLHDFERWNPECERGANEQYIALFREGECDVEFLPYVELSDVWDFGNVVPDANESGYEAVDFEVGDDGEEVMAVFYGGGAPQYFETLDRPDFESVMIDNEGQYRLEDMESFRSEETRYVSGLWSLSEERDDHEVGEVYGMFGRLLYMDQYTRKLEDFEVYPDAVDQRFVNVISQYLSMPQAYGFAVLQGGDVVADGGSGFAVRPVDSSGPGIAMTSESVGVSASVTKLVTTLGVIRYAEQYSGTGDWLDTYMVDVLPPDFQTFGAGVEQIKLRDLLTQQTGLETFDPPEGFDWTQDQLGWRELMKAWLELPLETNLNPQPRKYQNIHFELLALIMDEVVLPPIVPGADPWRTWVNDEVFAPVGIGPRKCYGTGGDARSYPFAWSNTSPGVYFAPNNWECGGNGTGIGMFWISPMDMAVLADGIRNGTVISSGRADDLLADGQGLDESNGVQYYTPALDTDANTIGEEIHSKNGGLIGGNGQDTVGMETITIMYDDLDHDDDGNGDYRYEIGHTELSVALTVNSTPIATGDPCPNDMCTRLFPAPWSMAVEALMQPEDW